MKSKLKPELKNVHDYLDKHDWIEMDTKHLSRIAGIFESPIADGAVESMGLKLYACTCGAFRIIDSVGRKLDLI